jgi:hypothetical protein
MKENYLLGFFFVFLLVSDTSSYKIGEPQGTVECGVCEFVMFAIYSYVTANSTESEITTIVGDICNYIPGEYSDVVNTIYFNMYPSSVQSFTV